MRTQIRIKLLFLILVFILFIVQVSASIETTINIKPQFGTGEEISFTYVILLDTTEQVEYIVSVDCPNAPIPLLDMKMVTLQAGISFSEDYIYLSSVNEQIEPQTCRAIVSIISPEEISEEKSFEIITNPSFEFDLSSCKDQSCSEIAKVFIKGENIYLDYISDVSDLSITTTLIYPDETKQNIIIPTSIKAEQVGTHDLEVTASKEGYKTITESLQFGVIEEDASIEEVDLSEDEIFYGRRIKDYAEENKYLIYFLIAAVVVILIVLIVYFKKRRKSRQLTKKKSGLRKELKKGLKKKGKIIMKKEKRLLKKLFHRKEKLPFGEKQELGEKIKQEKKVLTREKVGVRKEFSKKVRQEGKLLEKKERKIIESEKVKEIKRLLSVGRRQLSMGNKWGAKNTYRKIRRLHGFLKSGEKNRDLYNHILIFHERLNKKVK